MELHGARIEREPLRAFRRLTLTQELTVEPQASTMIDERQSLYETAARVIKFKGICDHQRLRVDPLQADRPSVLSRIWALGVSVGPTGLRRQKGGQETLWGVLSNRKGAGLQARGKWPNLIEARLRDRLPNVLKHHVARRR